MTTDNLLQLSELMVALHHCALEERDGRLCLVLIEAPDVVVNGRARAGGPLEDWDEGQRPLLLAWAREQTRRAWEELLGPPAQCATCGPDGTCGVCHLIERDADAIKVESVRLAGASDRRGPADSGSHLSRRRGIGAQSTRRLGLFRSGAALVTRDPPRASDQLHCVGIPGRWLD